MSVKNKEAAFITKAAVIAAIYVILTWISALLGISSGVIQYRLSEMLCILPIFTPAAIPGLTLGCVVSNLASIGQGLPLDMIFGSLATLGSVTCMYFLREVKVGKYPLLAMLMPAIWNGVIIGWGIEHFFIDGDFQFVGFLTQGGCVALGELGVMAVLGTALYFVIIKNNLHKKIIKKPE